MTATIKYITLWVIFLLALIAMLLSCGHHKSQKTKSPLDQVMEQRAFIVNKIITMSDEEIYKHRCDKLTFKALLSAFGPKQALEAFLYDDAVHRDTTPCFPEESRSEVSLDPILMMLHHIVTYKDEALFDELYRIGELRDWIMADGPTEYTNIYILIPPIERIKSDFALADNDYQSILAGYRGHITALLIHLQGRLKGGISEIEYQTLKLIYESNTENPLYSAIYHKYTEGGDQSHTINLLNKYFEFGIFPIGEAKFAWGSAPDAILYIVTVGIMEN